jgi:hypothetical protein
MWTNIFADVLLGADNKFYRNSSDGSGIRTLYADAIVYITMFVEGTPESRCRETGEMAL